MMLLLPFRNPRWIDQQTKDFRKPGLLVIETDQLCKSLLRFEIRIHNAAFENSVEGLALAHQ